MRWLRRALDRLCTGAGAVWWRMLEWPGRAGSWRGVGGRWAWLAFVCWGAYRMWQHAIPARVAIVAALGVAAWRAGGRSKIDNINLAPSQDGTSKADAPRKEQHREATPEQVRAYLLGLIQDLIADRNGVHLETILSELVHRDIVPASYRITDLRRDLIAAGIPVRDQLKIGRANRMGVHRDDAGGVAATPPPPLTVVRDSRDTAA